MCDGGRLEDYEDDRRLWEVLVRTKRETRQRAPAPPLERIDTERYWVVAEKRGAAVDAIAEFDAFDDVFFGDEVAVREMAPHEKVTLHCPEKHDIPKGAEAWAEATDEDDETDPDPEFSTSHNVTATAAEWCTLFGKSGPDVICSSAWEL